MNKESTSRPMKNETLYKGLLARRARAETAVKHVADQAQAKITKIEQDASKKTEAHRLEIEVVNNMLKELERLAETGGKDANAN